MSCHWIRLVCLNDWRKVHSSSIDESFKALNQDPKRVLAVMIAVSKCFVHVKLIGRC